MKSTTLRRSNITREKVAMMEALNNYNARHQDETYYKSQNKTKELDVLWQSFGIKSQRYEKAPQVYFVTGLIIGVIITLVITTILSLLISLSSPKERDIVPSKKVVTENSGKFSFIPADNASTTVPVVSNAIQEKYVVQKGDTLESIIIRFYGAFDLNKVDVIQKANKMSNPNALSIGQQLIIPMN